jgi:hypothetical protein
MAVYVCMRGLTLDEIGTSVAAGETFADDLGCEAEVCAAFAAAEVRIMAGKVFVSGRGEGNGVEVGKEACWGGVGG